MSINQALLQAVRQASSLLRLPELLLKAFIAVEGANPNHRDGVLQVIPSTRAALIPRIPRALKLTALGLDASSTLSDADLNARFAQAFGSRNLLVQVLTGGYYVREQLDRFHGYVALAGLAYNAGPARAARDIRELWRDDPYLAALQYHKTIGSASNQVTVQPGISQIDPATGVRWIRYPVLANDSGKEIFQYLYLRRVPNRNWGLLDFIFRPRLLERVGLFDNDQPPGEDRDDRVLAVANGQFRFVDGRVNYMFNTQPLSQRDPQWRDIPLGFTTEQRTIGSDGCTLTCVAMMANGFGFQETPATLNEKLKALGQNQGFFGTLIAWFGVARVLDGLRVDRIVECRNTPAPMGDIDAALEAGLPVIVELDQSPSPGFQNHWVLIYAKEGNDYLIHDPWAYPTESRATLRQRFGFAGIPAQIITYAVFYSHPNFQPVPIQPPQPQLVIVINDTPDIRAAGGVALRDKPSVTNGRLLTRLPAGTILTPLESPQAVREKVRVFNQWLRVRTPDNREGWVAAWLTHAREIFPSRTLQGDTDAQVQPELTPRTFARVKRSGQPVIVLSSPDQVKPIAELKPGRKVEVLEGADRIGEAGAWVRVRLGRRKTGYVASSDLTFASPRKRPSVLVRAESRDLAARFVEPDALPILQVTAPLGLNLRREPSAATSANILRVLPLGALILLRDPMDLALPNIGRAGEWLAVSTPDGVSGFVSSEFVALFATPETSAQIVAQQGVAFAAGPLALSQTPQAAPHWQVAAGTPLRLINPTDWFAIGEQGRLIEVETFAFKRGYVPADLLSAPDYPDVRVGVDPRSLPSASSAWLYGIHDEFDRGLFDGSGKTGWVLITDRVVSGTGRDYSAWSRAGYGVIARLNNDYGGSGTIPTPDRYLQFADQCRRWVQNSQGCHIWVIGNEMNNPREWPNQDSVSPGNNLADAITPERYAACFNRVRAAIKSVQPNAIVVPGAIDPFQGTWMSCLEYFQRMLDAIVDLDGIALHCYTHGYTPDLITSLETFKDEPLRWQYYHFRSYATLLDVIPPRHRNKPIYITETDPHGTTPWAGGQNGWVQAAYAEIDRYNAQPHAPQIQALVLYRWSRDDHYSIVDKPAVQADIRSTIRSTDYRWRQ